MKDITRLHRNRDHWWFDLRDLVASIICGPLFGLFLSVADLLSFLLVWVVHGRPLLYPEISAWQVLTDSAIAFVLPRVLLGCALGAAIYAINRFRDRRISVLRFAVTMSTVAFAAYALVRILHMGGPHERYFARVDIWNFTCAVALLGVVVGVLTSVRPPAEAGDRVQS